MMKLIPDNSSNVVKMNTSCYKNVSRNHDDDDDWALDEMFSLISITQKVSIDSTCHTPGPYVMYWHTYKCIM